MPRGRGSQIGDRRFLGRDAFREHGLHVLHDHIEEAGLLQSILLSMVTQGTRQPLLWLLWSCYSV
jgi:hypothetical protein